MTKANDRRNDTRPRRSLLSEPCRTDIAERAGDASKVFYAFLRLGCLSFGGPIAHLGYFHTEFVERRRWCDEETFTEVVGLAQSMPGPASSQVGFALGVLRAGWMGGLAAWVGFTMPSALLMLAFAFGYKLLSGRLGLGIMHGLQLVAVAVVAQAILSMRRSLAPDAARMGLALLAALIAFFSPPATGTVLAIAAGALLGGLLPRSLQRRALHLSHFRLSKLAGLIAAASFVALLLLLPIAVALTSAHQAAVGRAGQGFAVQGLAVFSAFYRSGALVFGGGHVVLPLLENAIVARGWVEQQSFLSGYGAAQALPGPLFTFAAYLGAAIRPAFNPVALSAVALIAIFLPGLLIMAAILPFWNKLRERPQVRASLRGVNAAVVGLLIAAFIRPVWSGAVHSTFDLAVALAALALLVRWKIPPWMIVVAVSFVSAAASSW